MKKIKVGLLGCGAIGSALAQFILKNYAREVTFSFFYDHHEKHARDLNRKLKTHVPLGSLEQIIQQSDLILEAASTKVSERAARLGLKANKHILIMSLGGLLPIQNLASLRKKSRGKLWFPSGAIAGLDAIQAGREGEIDKVTLITRKPPESLRQAPYFERRKFPLLKGNESKRVFSGTALQATKAFPQNINVAAALSFAGIGPRKTRVEIWTSRAYKKNQHEICVSGDFGEIRTQTTNVPSPENPKTSYLAILSAKATLRNIFLDLQASRKA